MARTSQRGYVLLALLLVLLITGSSILLGGFNNRQQLINTRQTETLYQLMQAREALLAFAANSASLYDNTRGPGYLPCPDVDGDRFPDLDENGFCDSATPLIGRLPDFADTVSSRFAFSREQQAPDSRFWYVVAPSYVYQADPDSRLGKSRTEAANLGGSNYIALLIAPGEALDFQIRDGNWNDMAAYLESLDADLNLISPDADDPQAFNDLVVGIRHDDYLRMLGAVVAGVVRNQVTGYYNDNAETYPESLEFLGVAGPAWTSDEDWIEGVLDFLPNPPDFTLGIAGCTYRFVVPPTSLSTGVMPC